jgi:polysaccharide biosynthesis/export protein
LRVTFVTGIKYKGLSKLSSRKTIRFQPFFYIWGLIYPMRTTIHYLLLFFAGSMLFSSCIPNKRLVYFQNQREPKRGQVSNRDTVGRTYNTAFREYLLKPNDIITVRVGSITPSEYDFVQKYEEQLGLIRKLTQYNTLAGQSGQQRQAAAGGGSQGEGLSSISLDRTQTGFILDDKGDLELPYIGKLSLAGLTIPQTEVLVREKLKGYFETPVVRIQLLNFHFTILGEVNNEGRYTTYDPNVTVIDAISLAGNLNDFADRSRIKVVRFEGQKAEVLYINTLHEDLLGQPGFYLQPNDLLIVPPLPARAARKYTLPASTTAISLISSTLTLVLFLLTVNN